MRVTTLLGMVLVSGCSGWGNWKDVPTATLTPVARPELDQRWAAAVANEMTVWNSALEGLGCPPPFVIGEAGHPVRLIAVEDWRDGAAFNGATDADEIRALEHHGGVPPVRGLLIVHELGHALGLHHADPRKGPSVMNADGANRWDPRDAVAAACAVGCGPCTAGADPYDLP
jgi:hypothetical protein